MREMNKRVFVLFFTLLYAAFPLAAPHIVVSIKPIHSLVANLTEGVSFPTLLMQNATSPHHYTIRPSEMRRLTEASLLLMVGESLEQNLIKVAKTLPRHVKVVELLKTPDLEPILYRQISITHSASYDPHIWLDPLRMIKVVNHIVKHLSDADPVHKEKYQTNAARLQEKLKALHETLSLKLNPIQNKQFLTFHDAYAYLIERYRLKKADFVVQHPEEPLSAEQLSELSKGVKQDKFACIFQEEAFPSRVMAVLTEHTKIPMGVLDPIGNRHPPGPTLYFKMMLDMANSMSNCLTQK